MNWTIGGFALAGFLLAIGVGVTVWDSHYARNKHSLRCDYTIDSINLRTRPHLARPCSCWQRQIYTVLLSAIAPFTIVVVIERAILFRIWPGDSYIDHDSIDEELQQMIDSETL